MYKTEVITDLEINSTVLVLGVKLVAHIQLRVKLLLKFRETELQRVHVFLVPNISVLYTSARITLCIFIIFTQSFST